MNYLTSLRGLAALLVVFYHLKGMIPKNDTLISPIINHGYLAVDFFLMLSGFIISYTYYRTFKNSLTISSVKQFLIKRFARIFPLHCFMILLFLIFPCAIYLTGREVPANIYSINGFIYKFLLIDLWSSDARYWSTWNFPSWTISGEWLAYILFPFFVYILKSNKLLILVTFSSCITLLIILYYYNGYESIGQGIETLGIFRCLLTFLIGICIYNANIWLKKYHNPVLSNISLVTCIAITVLLFANVEKNYLFVQVCFAWLLISLLNTNTWIHRFLELRTFVYLGDISYSVYLTHIFVRTLYTHLFLEEFNGGNMFDVFCIVTICILMSSLTYFYVEKPSRKWITSSIVKS